MKRLAQYLFLILLPVSLQSQVRLELLAPPGAEFSAEACWQLRLESRYQQTLRVYLAAELRDGQGTPAWVGRTASFNLVPGEQGYEQGSLPTIDQQQRDEQLEPGSYTLCVKVFTEDNEQELTRQCVPRQLRQPIEAGTSEEEQGKGPFQFGGTARITAQYSNQQNPYTTAPPSFARLEANPRLNVMGLPFQGRIFLSTEQQSLRYDINTINLQFDVDAFRRQLQAQLLARLKEEGEELLRNKLDRLREQAYEKAIGKLGDKAGLLESPELLQRFQELEHLDRIEALMALPVFDDLKQQWRTYENLPEQSLDRIQDSLRNTSSRQYAKFIRLREQAKEHRRLLDKREELQKLQKEMRKFLTLKDQIQEIEKLRERDYRSLLQDPRVLRKLGPLGKANGKAQQLLSQVRRFGLGTVFPYHSAYTLDGVSMRGIEFGISPGIAYAGVSAGNVQQTAFVNDTLGALAPRRLISARAGIGQPEGNHLHLHSLQAREAPNTFFTPRRNEVWALSGQLDFWGQRIRVSGEWAESLLRNDPNQLQQDSLPNWEGRLTQAPEVRGRAWQTRAEMRLDGGTRLRGRYAWVSPEFYSMGTPLLITDRERYEIRADQQLLKGLFSVGGFYRKDADNLLPFRPYKFTRTTVTSAGIELEARPKGWPYFRLSYAPFFQENDRTDSLFQQRNVNVMTATTGYNFQLGEWNNNLNLVYTQQLGGGNDSLTTFVSNMISLSHSLSWRTYSFVATGSWLHHDFSQDFNQTVSIDVSLNTLILGKATVGLGAIYMNEQEVLIRRGFYLNSNIPLTKKIQLELLAQRHHLDDFEDQFPVDTDYLIRAGIRVNW